MKVCSKTPKFNVFDLVCVGDYVYEDIEVMIGFKVIEEMED